MTTYENKNGKICRIDLPDDQRRKITQICFDCFSSTRHRDEFLHIIHLIKPLITQNSKTPTLDEAYIDGVTTALATLKQERP